MNLLYDTRAQLAAIEKLPHEYSFLHDTFCRDGGTVEDDRAIYDYRKGNRVMAPVVTDGTGGVPMLRTGFETREIGFCTIAPERIIENNDLKGRMFSERVLGAMTPQERERRMIAKDIIEMRRAIQRRIEWMSRQVLLTGKLSVFRYTHEGRDLETTLIADYGFTNNYTPDTPWDQAGAKIDDDMHEMFDLTYEGGGYVDIIVMDPESASAMIDNSKYIKQFDGRNIDMGKINTKYRGQGVRFIGWNSDGVEMYSLSGTFVDDSGIVQKLLPKGTIIAGARGILNCLYGPVTQVEENGMNAVHKTYIKKEVPLRIGSVDGNSIKTRLTSRPTIVPFNVDAWAIGSVL